MDFTNIFERLANIFTEYFVSIFTDFNFVWTILLLITIVHLILVVSTRIGLIYMQRFLLPRERRKRKAYKNRKFDSDYIDKNHPRYEQLGALAIEQADSLYLTEQTSTKNEQSGDTPAKLFFASQGGKKIISLGVSVVYISLLLGALVLILQNASPSA